MQPAQAFICPKFVPCPAGSPGAALSGGTADCRHLHEKTGYGFECSTAGDSFFICALFCIEQGFGPDWLFLSRSFCGAGALSGRWIMGI